MIKLHKIHPYPVKGWGEIIVLNLTLCFRLLFFLC